MNKTARLYIVLSAVFLLFGIRYLGVLVSEKYYPVIKAHDHFVLDYEYFYTMGKTAFSNPDSLYADRDNQGTKILLLDRRVFHPYPPPAAVFFGIYSLFPFAWSYIIYSVLIYFILFTALTLFIKALSDTNAFGNYAVPVLLCLCSGPAFLDISFGNVNSLVLLLCTLFLILFKKKKMFIAGVVLSLAFLLKLYPACLLTLLLFTQRRVMVLAGFISGAFAVACLSLLVVPMSTFKEFFFEIAPAYSRQTVSHVFNQSITAALYRSLFGHKTFLMYDEVLVPWYIRVVPFAILSVGMLIVFMAYLKKNKKAFLYSGAILCALIPVCTPIGWGYTFVLAFPALIILYKEKNETKLFLNALYCCCWIAFLTPSYHRIENMGIPEIVKMLYYSRYTIADLIVAGWLSAVIVKMRKELPGHSPLQASDRSENTVQKPNLVYDQ